MSIRCTVPLALFAGCSFLMVSRLQGSASGTTDILPSEFIPKRFTPEFIPENFTFGSQDHPRTFSPKVAENDPVWPRTFGTLNGLSRERPPHNWPNRPTYPARPILAQRNACVSLISPDLRHFVSRGPASVLLLNSARGTVDPASGKLPAAQTRSNPKKVG